jgi:4-oxalocrotonate tautomerase
MPHVIVKLYAGRSEAEKARLAEALAGAVRETLGSSDASISVAVEDVSPEEWAEQVYRPHILERPERLYRKPGYNPFG